MGVKTSTSWQPGSSGNPAGTQGGSRIRTALLLDSLAQDAAVELFQTLFGAALSGDMMAMRIISDRIWPVRRGRPLELPLPDDLNPSASLAAVVQEMAAGRLSPEEAHAASVAIMAYDRSLGPPPRVEPAEPRVVMYLPDNGRGDAGRADGQIVTFPAAE